MFFASLAEWDQLLGKGKFRIRGNGPANKHDTPGFETHNLNRRDCMNKKLIALAIAGAFALPVAAQAADSNVTVSGQMHLSLDNLDGWNGVGNAGTGAGGADLSRNWNVSSNASNIVFKGNEDLGNGLNAIFQIQTFFDVGGTGNADGSFGGTANGVGSGATFVGLSGNFGTVKLGKDESPFKILSRKVDLFSNQIGDSRNLTAAKAGANGSLGWDNRPNNAVEYNSPDMNGFQANAMYSTNLNGGATTDAAVKLWAVTGTYSNGPIFAGLGYEKHKLEDQTGLPAGMKDENAWRLSGGYNFGDFKLVAFYQRASGLYFSPTNNDQSRNTWGLGGAYKLAGNNTIKAQYYRIGNAGTTSNSGAALWALGFDHALSKRTTVYAAYARANNDSAANYSAFGGGHGDNPGTVTGKDPSGISFGVIHNF